METRFLLSVAPGVDPSFGSPDLAPVSVEAWSVAPAGEGGLFTVGDPSRSTRVDYRFDGSPQIEQLESGSIVTLEGEQTWISTGDAVVPVRDSSILLPQGMRITSVDVEYLDVGESLGSGIQLVATPAAIPTTGEFDSFDGWTTLVDTSLTRQDAVTFENTTLVGYNVGTLRVFPVEYDAVSGALTYHHEVSVRVTVGEIAESETVGIRDLEADRQRVAELVINPETLDTYTKTPSSTSTSSSTSTGPSTTSLAGQYDYVVVTTSALASSFQPLVNQKISRGLTATIMTTESISENYTGTETHDLADKIRHFLSDAYSNWNTQWVLLGGDSELIPQRGVYANVSGIAQDNNLPTDLYYSCLDGTWNGDGDSLWGESNDGTNGQDIDLVSDVFLGRAPVSNTTEAVNFVGKTVHYETTVHPNATTAVWLGELLNSESSVYGSYSGIPIRDATLPDDWSLIEHYDSAGGWTRDDLVEDLNASPHLVNHLGHSNATYNARLFNSTVSALVNDDPYFMYSQGCYSGAFDTRDVSIAERHVVDDHGAFGVVMNTRYGWYNAGTVPAFSHYYAMQFWDAVFNEDLVHLGQANQDSLADNFFRVGSTGVYRWIHMETTLFGDPETSFQLEAPMVDSGEIHGTVRRDTDADGQHDSNELGIANQQVFLDLNNNGVRDTGGVVSSTDTPVNIVDNTTVSSNITVAGLSTISDLNILLSITHPYDGDLTASLRSPSGTQVGLFSNVGGSGSNFTDTVLDDEASTSVTVATSPFSGSYRPANPLSAFDGENPNGIWTLEITDTATYDSGTLDSWSLDFNVDEPTATTDLNGAYSFTALANRDYRVRHIVPEGYIGTSPTNSMHTVTISGGESHFGIDFLDAQQSTSHDTEVLGVIDFLELEDIDLTSGDRWYSFETTRGGTLTTQANFDGASNELTMTLLNVHESVLADSTPYDGGQRLDWDAEPGEILLLRLSGNLSDVSLQMANLVQIEGTQVTAYGTSGDDHFAFAPGSWHEFSVNGIDYTFSSQDIHTFEFKGAGGTNDTAELLTSASGNEVAVLQPGLSRLTGTSFNVTVRSAENVIVTSMGGRDVIHMYDSPGDDTFVSTTETSTLSGGGVTYRAEGFRFVRAYHQQGGNDVAHLYDSSGDDEFIGRSNYAKMYRADIDGTVRVRLFPVVHAYSQAGGNDIASIYDSSGNDTVIASPQDGLLYGKGFYNHAHNFSTVNAYATSGFDRARLYDSPGDDWLKTTPTSAKLMGDDFLLLASRFDDVTCYATAGGNDLAHLYDSSGNDKFVATPSSAVLSGSSFRVSALEFDTVHSYAISGGNDVAHLYDSAGDDTFRAFPKNSILYGDGFFLRAKSFDAVHAYAKLGGHDSAYLFDSGGSETFNGNQNGSKMTGRKFLYRAKFFESVYAPGGKGGNDRVFLQDSKGNDRLDAAENWAQMTYANGNTIHVSNFTWVSARAKRGGHDVKHVESIDFVLQLYGSWTSI